MLQPIGRIIKNKQKLKNSADKSAEFFVGVFLS